MEVIGKIIRIENTEQISEKFKKRKLILEYSKNPNYPQVIEFIMIQNNVDLVDKLNSGDEIKVFFDLKGREVNDKSGKRMVFNTLELWRVEMIKKSIDYIEPAQNTEDTTSYNDDEPLPF